MSEKKTSRNRQSKPPYECIRCNYTTVLKTDMRKHLYELKQECQGIRNNIVLTNEIKEDILKNRKYHMPKESKTTIKKDKSELEKITGKDYYNYIYLLRPEESVLSKQNIYKVGMSIVKDKNSNISRLSSYRKGSEIILLAQCINANTMEREILNIFNQRFNRAYGNEYFVGDKYKMMEIIYSALKNEDKKQEEQIPNIETYSIDCNKNILDKFINDEIVVTSNQDKCVSMKDVYDEYIYWQLDQENKYESKINFEDLITYFNNKFDKINKKTWCGIMLRDSSN